MALGEIITGFEPTEEEDEIITDFMPVDTDIISDFEPIDTGIISDFMPTEKPVDRPTFEMAEAPLKAKYPNLYGTWGVAKMLVPYIKYIDPDERERFAELSTQKQTRELLFQNLETIAMLGTAGISAGIKPVAKALFTKYLPKTYRFLTAPIRLGRKIGTKQIAKITTQFPEHGLKYDGTWGEGAKALHQFTPQKGPLAGVTFSVKKPTTKSIRAKLKEKQIVFKEEMLTQEQIDALVAGKEIPTAKTPVEGMYDRTDIALEKLRKPSVAGAYQTLKRATVDISGNIKKDLLKRGGQSGKEAVIRHDLIRGAGPKSERLVNEASGRIYGKLSKAEETTLNRIIQSRRTIAIERYKPKMKHPEGLGATEHQAFLDSLPEEQLAKLGPRADAYFSEMKTQLDLLKESGLITDKSYQSLLKAGDYSPRQFIQHIDPERTYTFAGRRISVSDSGIQKLAEGSEQLLQNNSRALLAQVVTRTQARIFRNEANQALYTLAGQIPDNGVVKLAKVVGKTKAGKLTYQRPPTGYERVDVIVAGQRKAMLMPTDMAREWVVNDPAINTQMANIIGWLSGSKILKPMATGLNPEFAITNMPRDIVHAWLTTHEYSPHMPVWIAQMGRDFLATAKDSFLRKGAWNKYIDEGGGMSFLTHQGRITKGGGIVKTLQDVLAYAGETSEIWTRLALRQRAIRNGKAGFEATWEARNYLDFSQGGWAIKGADTAVPYLNASIQATRGLARAASEKPLEFMYKVAELGTLATSLYLANRYTNRECWDSVSDTDKINNFIITTPWTYTDKNNETRHLYFKVAKDQSQRLTCTVFENMMGKYFGEDIDVDQITQAAQDLIPIVPTQSVPPAFDAMLGYYANKDFWMNEDIWRGPKVEPSQEYTRFTHPALVEIGKLGLSPERMEYALENFFTSGNIYTSLVGGGLKQIMDQLPGDVKEATTEEMLTSMPFVRRVLKSTYPYAKHRKDVEDIKIAASTERYIQTRNLDALSEVYYKDKTTADKKAVFAFIKEQPPEDRSRLHQRFIRHGKVYNIPDKRWWLNLAALTPEARATVYWTRWQQADKEEKRRLEKQLPRIPGIISGKFVLRLQQLKRKKVE